MHAGRHTRKQPSNTARLHASLRGSRSLSMCILPEGPSWSRVPCQACSARILCQPVRIMSKCISNNSIQFKPPLADHGTCTLGAELKPWHTQVRLTMHKQCARLQVCTHCNNARCHDHCSACAGGPGAPTHWHMARARLLACTALMRPWGSAARSTRRRDRHASLCTCRRSQPAMSHTLKDVQLWRYLARLPWERTEHLQARALEGETH